MQMLTKNEVEFVSAESGVCCFWIHLWLFISSGSQGGSSSFWLHYPYRLHLPLEGAAIVMGGWDPWLSPGRHCSVF